MAKLTQFGFPSIKGKIEQHHSKTHQRSLSLVAKPKINERVIRLSLFWYDIDLRMYDIVRRKKMPKEWCSHQKIPVQFPKYFMMQPRE